MRVASSGLDVLGFAVTVIEVLSVVAEVHLDIVCFALSSDSILGLYERIQVYQKFASDVPVRMVLKDTVDKTLTRDV